MRPFLFVAVCLRNGPMKGIGPYIGATHYPRKYITIAATLRSNCRPKSP